ncbi:MAG: hypothetical protein ACSHYA_15545 [Opitutaceae bacterium]
MTEMVIVPELAGDFKPAFDSEEEYAKFREDFSEEMQEVLLEQSRARARSEEEIRRKRVF